MIIYNVQVRALIDSVTERARSKHREKRNRIYEMKLCCRYLSNQQMQSLDFPIRLNFLKFMLLFSVHQRKTQRKRKLLMQKMLLRAFRKKLLAAF